MKAIDFTAFGGPDVLKLVDVDPPEVRQNDLLVRVHAAGVNRADLLLRTGHYGRPDFGDSRLIGLEVAGEVVAVGDGVKGFAVGDRIMGITGGGAYAELARLDYRMAMPIPLGLDYTQAAAIPEVFVTANEALVNLGRLKPHESVLIHAAASGVGSAAVQLAHALGARVFATAAGGKLERVRSLGADTPIDYKHRDFVEAVHGETNGTGVDVIVDFIGAPYFARNIECLNYGGRLVQVGLLGGGEGAAVDLERVIYRHLQILGTVMKSRTQEAKQAMVKRFRDQWLERFADGTLVPVIDSTYPLADAAEAHRRMETNQSIGKIVLTNG